MNTETKTAVRISLDYNKQLQVEAVQATLPDAIQLCLAAIEALCKQTLSRADTPDLKKSLEETSIDMYEMINMGASTLLDRLFPEITARPDLTVDAILAAEDALIADKDKLQTYVDAYEDSAQSKKDAYEHQIAKANLKAMTTPQNRAQRRKKK